MHWWNSRWNQYGQHCTKLVGRRKWFECYLRIGIALQYINGIIMFIYYQNGWVLFLYLWCLTPFYWSHGKSFPEKKILYGETNINSVIVCLSNLFIFSSRNFHWECDCNYGCGWKWIYHWNFFDLPKQGFLKWCIACHDDILCILSKKGIVLFV